MANLFPRTVKSKVGHAVNRLEVLDAGTPSPPPQGRAHVAPRALTAPGRADDLASPSEAPHRPVILTTVRKAQPLRRHNRNLARGRGGGGDRRDRDRKARDEADPLEECVNATNSFNHLMRQSQKKPRRERRDLAVRVVQRMKAFNVPFDTEAYNLLLKLLCDSGDEECFRIYDQMKEDAAREDGTVKPDLDTYRTLIRACERTGEYRRAFSLFAEMKDLFGLQPDVSLYNTLMGFCVHSRNEHQASVLFEEMKERRVQPNVHTYNCLMNVFSESPYELLAQMFEDMHKQRIKPNLRTHNTLMRACQRADDYDRCFKFFEDLKHEGIKPDVMTYNILLEMCRDRLDYVQGKQNAQSNRRSKEQQLSGMKAIAVLALSLFNEMDEKEVRPNTFTYNALMGVLARCADLRVFTVFKAMKEDWKEEEEDRKRLQQLIESGELPEVDGALALAGLDSQGDLMLDDGSGAALRGHYQRLRAGEEESARINAFGVKPDLTTYQTLIHAAERMGRADAAYDVFEEMKRAGIKAAKETYVKMMDVCVLRGETERAGDLFREAKRKCILPDIEMYNAYMNVLAEAGNEHIFTVFDEVCKDYDHLNIKPNQVTYNTLIKACCKLRRPGEGMRRGPLDAAERAQLEEEEIEWNKHRAREAFKLYEQMCEKTSPVQPNVDTYNTLIDVCCITKDIAKARDLMRDMQARDHTPTITTYNRYLNVFVAADDDGIVEVFQILKQPSGPYPNLESYTILLGFYRRRQDAAILSLFDDMKKSGNDPDSNVYNIMLQYCAAIRDKRKSLKFFEELKVRELVADIETYNALMAVFAESGDDLIFKVFEEMIENSIAPDKKTFSTLIKHKRGLECLKKASEKGLLFEGLMDPRAQEQLDAM
eukprot:TRINITY_DN43283_c0_g1_i1.p1 TRINITY_DN43283_c0_g1~~TRINITY_DN43283_c0_g1_i1.p1  ORF type:complete len:901 (+),score=308.83 TRINITY_DN43283_c0_g1_i1:61-2703(+)